MYANKKYCRVWGSENPYLKPTQQRVYSLRVLFVESMHYCLIFLWNCWRRSYYSQWRYLSHNANPLFYLFFILLKWAIFGFNRISYMTLALNKFPSDSFYALHYRQIAVEPVFIFWVYNGLPEVWLQLSGHFWIMSYLK